MKHLLFLLLLLAGNCWAEDYENCFVKNENNLPVMDNVTRGECIDKDLKIANKELATLYKKGLSQSSNKKSFAATQTAWQIYKQKQCEYIADTASGSTAPIDISNCHLDLTLQRVVYLKNLIN